MDAVATIMRITTKSTGEISPRFYTEIAHYRYKVFVETLGWELQTQNGEELDQFDRPDTYYAIAQNDDGEILGCARLLPTDKPYLLGDVFPELMNGQPLPNSAEIWELSRFAAVDFNNKTSGMAGQFSSAIAVDLLRGALQYAKAKGAKRLVSVSPVGVERLLRQAGFKAHRAGPPMIIDGHPIFACWIELEDV